MNVVCAFLDASQRREGVRAHLSFAIRSIARSSVTHFTPNSVLTQLMSITAREVADVDIQLLSPRHRLLLVLADVALCGSSVTILSDRHSLVPHFEGMRGELSWTCFALELSQLFCHFVTLELAIL